MLFDKIENTLAFGEFLFWFYLLNLKYAIFYVLRSKGFSCSVFLLIEELTIKTEREKQNKDAHLLGQLNEQEQKTNKT
jgi:hypothetical protein